MTTGRVYKSRKKNGNPRFVLKPAVTLERIRRLLRDENYSNREAEESLVQSHERWSRSNTKRSEELERINQTIQNEIAEHLKTQEALIHSEELFRSLSENSTDIITILARDGTIRYQSPSIRWLLGYEPNEMEGKNVFHFVHPDDLMQVQRKFNQLLTRAGSIVSAEYRFLHKDGSWLVLESIGKNLLNDPVVGGLVVNSRDLTRRREIEIEKDRLFEQVRQQREQLRILAIRLRQLANQVIKAQEEERRMVSRELHDEAGQALTVLKVSLELMLADLAKSQADPLLSRRMGDAIGLCETTMAQIRMLAHHLRPAALDDLGLNLTLEGFCRDFAERTRLSIEYDGVETPELSDAAEICLYRFLQEGLTNVAKHAGASLVCVNLHYDEEYVRLAIQDNGRSFNYQAEMLPPNHSEGIGLLGLQERLVSVGGRIEISSEIKKGTCLSAIVPMKHPG